MQRIEVKIKTIDRVCVCELTCNGYSTIEKYTMRKPNSFPLAALIKGTFHLYKIQLKLVPVKLICSKSSRRCK
jgi:hypothetical protein